MRLGQLPAAYTTTGRTGRVESPRYGGGPRVPDFPDVGAAVSRAGATIGVALQQYEQETRQRRDFATLQRFTEMTGQVMREADELAQRLPPNGEGYTRQVEDLYMKRWSAFARDLDPDQREEYGFRGQSFFQPLLRQSIQFERDAAKGHAIATIDEFTHAALGKLYDEPGLLPKVEQELGDFIYNSPLSAAEKADVARKKAREVQGAAFTGTVAGGIRARFAAPGSDYATEVFEKGLLWAESSNNPNVQDSLPHPVYGGRGGALGEAQVLLDTGRGIAARMGDENFPFTGDEEQQKQYIRENSYRYGKFYFEEHLRDFGGDIRLALIRYNGGNKAVENFRRAGDSPAGFNDVQQQTKEHVEKIFDRLGLGDPWHSPAENIDRAGLTVEQRQTLDAVQQQFDQARLAAAQQLAEQDQERFNREYNRLVQQVLTKIYASPTVDMEAHLEEVVDILNEYGIEGEQREQLLRSTQMHVEMILAERSPDRITDTDWFSELPYETRRQLEAQAQREEDQRQRQAEAERSAQLDRVFHESMALAHESRFGFDEFQSLVEAGLLERGSPRYFQLMDKIETVQAENITAGEVNEQLHVLGRPFTPSAENRARLGIYFDKSGILQALENPESQAQRGEGQDGFNPERAFVDIWNKSGGVMPTNAKTWLETRADSYDTRTALSAFRLMSELRRSQQSAFQREMGEDLTNRVLAFEALMELGMPEEAILARLHAERDMDPSTLRILRQQADEQFTGSDKYTPFDLRREFAAFWPLRLATGTPVFGEGFESTPNGIAMYQDYMRLYRSLYAIYGGDSDMTHKKAVEGVRNLYGMFEGVLVKYPPQNHYTPIDGSTDWVMEQFREQYNVRGGDRVVITTDNKENSSHVAAGLMPGYGMLIVREDGGNEFVPRWTGNWDAAVEWRGRRREVLGYEPTAEYAPVAENRPNVTALDVVTAAQEGGRTGEEMTRTWQASRRRAVQDGTWSTERERAYRRAIAFAAERSGRWSTEDLIEFRAHMSEIREDDDWPIWREIERNLRPVRPRLSN